MKQLTYTFTADNVNAVYTTADLARMLNCRTSAICSYINQGRLPTPVLMGTTGRVSKPHCWLGIQLAVEQSLRAKANYGQLKCARPTAAELCIKYKLLLPSAARIAAVREFALAV